MSIRSLPRNKSGCGHAPRRVEQLAVLPVFLRLQGRKAVVAGGTDAAAWKAELLAATGATVHVYANELSQVFEELIHHAAASGSIVWHNREWDSSCLGEAAVAVADAANDGQAAAFFQAAKVAGVPANVIDRPEFCTFQFGSIVNRSPVVIGISTDGAAPILGQAIRRRVEALLPPALGAWAGLAQRLRTKIHARLQPGRPRRLFWERFADRAFGPAPGLDAEAELALASIAIASGKEAKRGCLTIAAAEPSDPELLTLKTVRALQAADIILHERRFNAAVLELGRREAKRVAYCENRPAGEAVKAVAAGGKGMKVVALVPTGTRRHNVARRLAEYALNAGIALEVAPDLRPLLPGTCAATQGNAMRQRRTTVPAWRGWREDGPARSA